MFVRNITPFQDACEVQSLFFWVAAQGGLASARLHALVLAVYIVYSGDRGRKIFAPATYGKRYHFDQTWDKVQTKFANNCVLKKEDTNFE